MFKVYINVTYMHIYEYTHICILFFRFFSIICYYKLQNHTHKFYFYMLAINC